MKALPRVVGVCLARLDTVTGRLPFLVFTLLFSSNLHAACDDWVARVVSIQGQVDVRSAGAADWQPVKLQQTYCVGDTLRVQASSRAALELHNDTILRLNQNSTLVLSGPKQEASWLDLLKGSIHSISRVPRSLKIKTPFVNAAVEGTEFLVKVNDDHTLVGVIEGKVAVSNEQGRILLAQDQSAVTFQGQAPVLRLDIRPSDSVQWTLYYPALNVAGLKEAETLLRVGQVDAARAVLQGNDSAEALSLRSVIAVASNDKAAALELSSQAIAADASLAAARVAHSYALQAAFDLPAAREAALLATQKAPTDAIAWARLAELDLSLAELDKGLAAARRAVELEPDLARTQTLLGFAQLLRYDIAAAKQAFSRSIELDSADPLARLGMGLATIREGDLQQGRREIEIAASLDTNNAQIRSYLGKAYLEEQRNQLAAEQFALAKQMDPKDPTPWLYSAILMQGQNDPVSALRELDRARELNDNRAVYRSSFMLDSDLAVKSADLGGVYQKLGFEQQAIVEANRSLSLDPNNYSAHRLLSDMYRTRPRHEIARVSELLQSQLLQPINNNPVQPQSAESTLTLLNSPGVSDSSLNEYGSLFMSGQQQARLSVLEGGKDTRSYEALVSAIGNESSVSVSRYHYETDGFHSNNGEREDLFDLFVQSSLTDKLGVLFDYSENESREGDAYRFDPANFNTGLTRDRAVNRKRFGFRYSLAANNQVIATHLKHRVVSSEKEPFPPFGDQENAEKADSSSSEIRWSYVTGDYSIILGGGKTQGKQQQDVLFLGFTLDSQSNSIEEENGYIYFQHEPVEGFQYLLGVSTERYSVSGDLNIDDSEVNPKFGVSWQASDKTSLRLSYFENYRRSLLNDQTIEPVTINGFNQFYTEPVRSKSEQYSLGVDYRFNSRWYAGLELTDRSIDVPYFIASVENIANWKEFVGSAYINWVPSHQFAVRAGYEYEDFDRDELDIAEQGYEKVKTHRLPLKISMFRGDYAAEFDVAYVRQEGEFVDQVTFVADPGSDNFWVADAKFSYLLKGGKGRLVAGVKNIFNENFRYQDTDPNHPRFAFERLGYVSLNLMF